MRTSAPSDPKTSSNARVNFASRSRSRNRSRRPRSPSISSRLRACWATQAPSGWAVTPARQTRRVSSSMKNSTYNRRSHTVSTVKQVTRHDPGGLLAQEDPPGRGHPPWRGIQPVVANDCADRGGRNPDPEALELALDALVAPARVLSSQADDQLLHVLVQRWPAGLMVRVGPGAGDQPPVPAQRRL